MEDVNAYFDEPSAAAILAIPLALGQDEDVLKWIPDSIGAFSVISAYRGAHGTPSSANLSNFDWNRKWKLKMQHCLRLLLWKIMVDALPLRGKLAGALGCLAGSQFLCPFCEEHIETASHLFLECPLSQCIWRAGVWPI